MKNIYIKLILITLILLQVTYSGVSQSFTQVLHEYNDFPYIREIIHGDFNNDGKVDFVIAGDHNVKIGFGNGADKPQFSDIDSDIQIYKITAIDLNDDGNLDFIGSATFKNSSYVWINDGTGSFVRQNLSITDYHCIHFADLNGDGITNAIAGIDDQLAIYDVNQGNLSFNKMIFEDAFTGYPGSINSLDYDKDGKLDIVVAFNSDGVLLFEQANNFEFNKNVLFSDTYNNDELYYTDLNKDGTFDFILQSDQKRKSTILMSTSPTDYTPLEIPRTYNKNLFTQVADLNEDGTVEIVHADGESPSNTEISIFNYNNSSKQLEKVVLSEDHAETEDGGVTDIDGDGDLDIYIYTNDFFGSGIVFYLQESSSAVHDLGSSTIEIYPNPTTDYINLKVVGNLNYQSKIFDLKGKLILSNFNTNKISIGELAVGTYILEFTNLQTGQKIFEKIVKSK